MDSPNHDGTGTIHEGAFSWSGSGLGCVCMLCGAPGASLAAGLQVIIVARPVEAGDVVTLALVFSQGCQEAEVLRARCAGPPRWPGCQAEELRARHAGAAARSAGADRAGHVRMVARRLSCLPGPGFI